MTIDDHGNRGNHGNYGTNVIDGGNGSDGLYCEGGDDLLVGGQGADVFHFELGDGQDVIRDFIAGEDHLSFGASYDDIFVSAADAQSFLDQYASYSDAGAYLNFAEDSSIFFVDVTQESGDLELMMAEHF